MRQRHFIAIGFLCLAVVGNSATARAEWGCGSQAYPGGHFRVWAFPSQGEANAALERVFALFPRLKERMIQRGGTLSGGEQQMLAIGRALMSRPRLLMLDEPSLGLAPLIARQIFDAIRTLNRQDGLTVLIVEQNANHALRLAHRGYVLVNGLITLSGTGSELLQRPEVRSAYLEGGRHA